MNVLYFSVKGALCLCTSSSPRETIGSSISLLGALVTWFLLGTLEEDGFAAIVLFVKPGLDDEDGAVVGGCCRVIVANVDGFASAFFIVDEIVGF
jgi:hypothetical protein